MLELGKNMPRSEIWGTPEATNHALSSLPNSIKQGFQSCIFLRTHKFTCSEQKTVATFSVVEYVNMDYLIEFKPNLI